HASVHLVGAVADLEMGFTGHCLGKMYAGGRWTPGVELPQSLISGPTGGVQVIDHADDVILHPLETPDGLAKLNTRAAIRHSHLEDRLAGTHLVGAQDRNALHGCCFQALPTAPLDATEDSVSRHLKVFYAHLIHLSHPTRQCANRHARVVGIHDQERDAATGAVTG